jgi:hypothetical protein
MARATTASAYSGASFSAAALLAKASSQRPTSLQATARL